MSADRPPPSERTSLAERVASRLNATQGSASRVPAKAPARETAPEVEAAAPRPPAEETSARAADLTSPISSPPLAEVQGEETPPATAGVLSPSSDVLQINFQKLQAGGFITPASPRTGNTEAIRTIKRQLLKTAFPNGRRVSPGGNENVIMVTSSLPGEGKTFVSLNLAMSLSAERDLYVLLIDGDTHRRSLGELLGAKTGVGLVDMLTDSSLKVGELIQRTNIPNLSFLPGGRPHPNSSELIASKQFGSLMHELSARYPDRVIIIDTAPVLASTEAAVLSSYVGQTMVVVEKDRTAKRQLQRTLEMLEGGRNVGCILNMVPSDEVFTDYGY